MIVAMAAVCQGYVGQAMSTSLLIKPTDGWLIPSRHGWSYSGMIIRRCEYHRTIGATDHWIAKLPSSVTIVGEWRFTIFSIYLGVLGTRVMDF